MSEKVSVIVPVFNVEKYLNECIQSLINQTYSDIEIILVDDGSSDMSPEICDSYASDKVKVYHKNNGGLSSARNFGIEKSTGRFLCFVDSDDCVDSNFIELMYQALRKAGDDCLIAMCCFTRKRDDLGKGSKTRNLMNNRKVLNNILYQKDDLLFSVAACNKMYYREVFEDIGYPLNKLNEDMFVICDIISKTPKVVVVDYNGYYYRVNQSSITQSSFKHKNMDVIEACDIILNFVSNNEHYKSLKNAAVNLKFRRSFQMLYKLWLSDSKEYRDEQVLYNYLKKMAPVIMHDKNAKKSTKMVAYATLLGKRILKCLVKIKFRLLSGTNM